jgi:hypothetical protein
MVSVTCEAIFPELAANFDSQARVESKRLTKVLILCCDMSGRKFSVTHAFTY